MVAPVFSPILLGSKADLLSASIYKFLNNGLVSNYSNSPSFGKPNIVVPNQNYFPPPKTPSLTFAQVLAASPAQLEAWGAYGSQYQTALGLVIATMNGTDAAKLTDLPVAVLGGFLQFLPLAAIPKLNISKLSGAAIADAGTFFINGLSDTQVANLNVSSQLIDILRNLAPAQIQDINARFFSKLPVASLAVAMNFMRSYPSSSRGQFGPLMSALNAAQANAIFAQLTTAYVNRLPGNATPQTTNLAGLEQFINSLPRSIYALLTPATVAAVSPILLAQLPASDIAALNISQMTGQQLLSLGTSFINQINAANLSPAALATILTSSIVPQLSTSFFRTQNTATFVNTLLSIPNTGSTRGGVQVLRSLNATQIAGFTSEIVNGLLTSDSTFTDTMLNIGQPSSWSSAQFQAMVSIPSVLASINPNILRNALSVPALLSLTRGQIAQLTGTQWQAILANSTLSKVIYNAGSGNGYWTLSQLQSVSVAAIPYMTLDQYLQFAKGLSMFSQVQQNAMSTNVALLEIMVTGQTSVWTQAQISWIVKNIPRMIQFSGLPGGGNSFKENNIKAPDQMMVNYRTITNDIAIQTSLSQLGWNSLSAANQQNLLGNYHLPTVLAQINSALSMSIMSNASLMPRLTGANLVELISAIAAHLPEISPAAWNTFVPLSQAQVNSLLVRATQATLQKKARVDTLAALSLIAQNSPAMLGGLTLSQAQVDSLLTLANDGNLWQEVRESALRALISIAQKSPAMLGGLTLSQTQVDSLLALANDATFIEYGRANALGALRDIAQNAPSMLGGRTLSQAQVDSLLTQANDASLSQIARRHVLPALSFIAQNAPSMLGGRTLSQAQVDSLLVLANDASLSQIARGHVLAALRDIADNAPAMLSGRTLSQAQVDSLLALANDASLSQIGRANALAALSFIAQNAPTMFNGLTLSQAQVNSLIALVNDASLSEDFRETAIDALVGIARKTPTLLTGIRITDGFYRLLDNEPELRLGLNNLLQTNLVAGFDEGVITSERLTQVSTVPSLEGLVSTLIANNHQGWINQSLQTVGDANLQVLFQPEGGQSRLNTAAQMGAAGFAEMYAAISASQGGNYSLSSAAFEAYAVRTEGAQYLNWLIEAHPNVVTSTLTPVIIQAGGAYVYGLSGVGISSTFLTEAGNIFWNQLAVNNPNIVTSMQNNWANVFSNWSANAVQNLGRYAVDQGQGGFIGLISQNANARALLSGAIQRAILITPELFDIYAQNAATFLSELVNNYLDVTQGSLRPYTYLTVAGLRCLIQNGQAVLADADPAQIAAIPTNVLANLSAEQASLLPQNFWSAISDPQLTAMFNSPTLGAAFFSAPGTANHISVDQLQAISADVLSQAYQTLLAAQQAIIIGDWANLTVEQKTALSVVPGFIAPVSHAGFAGDLWLINQQLTSGISLAATEATVAGNLALAASTQSALTEVQKLIESNHQGEVTTGSYWAKGSTITVSTSGFRESEQLGLTTVLNQYAAVTGLAFQRVSSNAQITLGFTNLNTANTGLVGLATTQSANGVMQSANILLENPAESPLDANGNYTGTQASFMQVIMHELGHALGLADNNLTGSVENYYLGSGNQSLSTEDIAALQSIYGTPSNASNISSNSLTTGLTTVEATNQLTQAMAGSLSPGGSVVTTSTDTFMSTPSNSISLALVFNTVHG